MEKNRLEREQQGFSTYENDAILVVFEESKQQAAAYDGDKMIGECQYNVAGTAKWIISHTGVRPEYNGRGIAKRLVECVIAAARERGVHIVPLCTYAKHMMCGQDGSLGTIASTYHYSYGIATITEVTPTVANAELAEMQNLLTVCKFSFLDKDQPETLLLVTSLSISYGDGDYAGTYPETATVTVTQGTPCTVAVTPTNQSKAAGGYALSVVPTGNPTEVYVALFPEATATTYSFRLESGENTYTGTATAQLIAGEYVVATGLKLTKVNH